jgi:hypothetical protein
VILVIVVRILEVKGDNGYNKCILWGLGVILIEVISCSGEGLYCRLYRVRVKDYNGYDMY